MLGVSSEPNKTGHKLKEVLERNQMVGAERAAFLQHLERECRAEADFEMLREIQEYKKLASLSIPQPPED